MKQKLRLLSTLLLLAVASATWGEKVTFTFSELAADNSWTNGTAYTAVELTPITLKAEGGGNNGKYYTSDNSWRMYNGGTVKISAADGYVITDVSSTPSQTFTIEDGEASLSCSATIKFTTITVTYSSSGSTTDPSINAGNVEIEYDVTSGNIEYSINNATGETLSASTTSDWLTLGTVSESTVPFTCSANSGKTARTATVTLTYGTARKNVIVTQAANPNAVDNISDITAAGTYAVQGTIVAKSQRGFVVGDGTGYVYYYNQNYTQADYNVGDKVKLSGSIVAYGGVFEFNNTATVTAVTESNYVAEDPTVLTGAQMDSRVASTTPALSGYVQYEGTLSVSETHYNITNIDGATTAVGSISYPLNTDFTSLAGKTVKVTGYFVGISSSKYYNTMLGSIEEVVDATPIIDANDVTLAYDATSGEIAYTVNNAVDGKTLNATTDADWISNVVVGDEAVTFTTTANEGNADRTATITLSYEGAEDKTVTVTQRYHVADYATLPFEFNGGRGDITTTAGLTQSGLGDDYKNAPKLKFDHAGDELVLKFNERPGKLSFDVKGNPGGDPSVWNAVFKVQTSTDGINYTDLASYDNLESTNTTKEFNTLDANVRYIKWVYTEKVSGNVALGNIKLEAYVAPQNFTLTIPETDNVTITAAYGEDQMLEEGQNAAIEQNTEIILTVDAAEGYDLKSLTVTGPDGQSFAPQAVPDTEGAYKFTMPAYNATVNAAVVEHVEPTGATYVLATAITSGKHYVIANGTTSGNVKVMGSQNTNNRAAVDATIGDDGKLSVSDDQYEFVIESATIDEASGYSIFDAGENGGYLYAASSSSNHLKTQTTNNVNGIWKITFEDGHASIVAQGDNTRNTLRYNSNSDIFSCYASGQADVYLFEKVEETPQPEVVTATITDAGYATFANENAVDFSAAEGLTVLTAQYDYATGKINYTTVESKKVPAATAVVLKGEAKEYTGTVIDEAPALDENNDLQVNLSESFNSDGTQYCLAKKNEVVGFYKVKAGVAVKAGKAYLVITASGAKDFYAIEDETDGINAINNSHQTVESVYNLSGQRVNKAQKGIYIVNGKKVVIR